MASWDGLHAYYALHNSEGFMRNSVAQRLRSLTLVQRVPGSIPGRAQKIVSIAARSITASEESVGKVQWITKTSQSVPIRVNV